MRFLALTGSQTAALALVVAGAIVAMYFLKLRHRRVFVPSSLLWRRVLDDKQAHSLWERLRRILSIILAVIIGLLLALAIARPEWEWLTGATERIAIVVDTSPTMLARRADGRTRWQHAMDAAGSLLRASSPTTEFRLSDTSGRLDSGFTRDRWRIQTLMEETQPAPSSFRFPEVQEGVRVYFISDGVSRLAAPPDATRISVFEPVHNAGITAFEVRAMPSSPLGYEAYLEVRNYGLQASEIGITVSGPGRQRITRTIRLDSAASFAEPFDLSLFDGGGIRAVVRSDGDGFPLDDVAYAYLPVQRRTRTLLVTSGNSYLEAVLKLNSLVDLTVTPPSGFLTSPGFDAYIFDRFAPPEPPSRPALILGTPAAPWLLYPRGTVSSPAFTTWIEDHPLVQHVSLHDVSIQHAAHVDGSNLTVVAASGNTPLILASEKPRWVMLTFDLQSTDFPFQAGFPVFMENVLSWLGRERLALARTPGLVEVPLARAEIQHIDGRTVPSRQYLGQTVFETSEPGLYIATEGNNRQYVAVNLANRQYSGVNTSIFRDSPAPPPKRRLIQRELWFYMMAAALVLAAAEWFTYHRRITL